MSVCGWVAHRRDHGEHLAFLDVRDHTGLVQCVVEGAQMLRPDPSSVVRVTGTVRLRPDGTENPALPTGQVELGDCVVETLAEADPPPLSIDGRTDTDEQIRLRYRFLDLRSERMQANLRLRAKVNSALRRAMDSQGFTEFETPLLWTPTPEGAREFAIPSRLAHGSFYVLPQSPQIAKQLAMVGGFDRYFQIARCMRDEDLRADRQFEFTQLDMEASFVTQADIRAVVSEAVAQATEAVTGERPGPIEEMTWDEAIDRYGSDKPDLRFAMPLVDLGAVLAETEFNAFRAPAVRAITLAGGAELGRARLDALVERAKSLGAKGLGWMRAVAGEDGARLVESPVAKFLSPAMRSAPASSLRPGRRPATSSSSSPTSASASRRCSASCGSISAGRRSLRARVASSAGSSIFRSLTGGTKTATLVAAHHPPSRCRRPSDLGVLGLRPATSPRPEL